MIAYRDQFLNVPPLDTQDPTKWRRFPIDILQYLTITQAFQALLLLGLPKDVRIAHYPRKVEHGWSKKSIIWLTWMEAQLEIHIQHKGNSEREKRVKGNYPVDGYGVDLDGHIYVLQFYGCYWHGCPKCYPDRAKIHPQKAKTMQECFDDCVDIEYKIAIMRNTQVIKIWECEFDQEESMGVYDIVDREILKFLKPSDYFFGGRVETFAMYYKCHDGEKILFSDVCSMYPSICVNKPLPIGHPQVFLGPACDMMKVQRREYVGIIRCVVACPTEDFMGLLPHRMPNGRLVFSVSGPKEGSWTTPELYYAMDHGYQVVKVYEVYNWPPDQMMTGLFRGYMDTFLASKLEADGWPREDMTEEEKDAYILDVYDENGGIGMMDKSKVAKNPAKRMAAKGAMNSSWGKLVQQPILSGHQIITTKKQFRQAMMNPTIKEGTLQFMHTTEDTMLACYEIADEHVENARRFNAPIGAFVTAYGRIMLAEYCYSQDIKPIYCDTDSVSFILQPGRPMPVYQAGMGKWTNVFDDGIWGTEFMSTGPKSYCVVYNQPDKDGATYMLKSKGLTLNYENQKILNPDTMRASIMAYYRNNGVPDDHASVLLNQFTIRSKILNGGVFVTNITNKKKFQVTNSKRYLHCQASCDEGGGTHFITTFPMDM